MSIIHLGVELSKMCVPYKEIEDKSRASAIAGYSSSLVRYGDHNTLLYDYGILQPAGPGILQSELIIKG
jgi:hypothetical protein